MYFLKISFVLKQKKLFKSFIERLLVNHNLSGEILMVPTLLPNNLWTMSKGKTKTYK